jgi:DNA invertase Pin-like site-specific DNA recombinase
MIFGYARVSTADQNPDHQETTVSRQPKKKSLQKGQSQVRG